MSNDDTEPHEPSGSPGPHEPGPQEASPQEPTAPHTPGRAYQAPEQDSDRGFFSSVRRTGVVRTQDRWAGGVAGGVARRLGIDPALVRCLWIVLSAFTGVGPLVYGLCWAVLPEEGDGRIHVEEALAGRFEAGLAGAVGSVLVGMSLIDHGILPGLYIGLWDVPGLGWTLWSLFWLALLALVLVGGIRYLSRQRVGDDVPPPAGAGAPDPAGATASPTPTAWTAPEPAASARPSSGPGDRVGTPYHGSRTPYPGGPGAAPQPSSYQPYAPTGYSPAAPRSRPRRPGPGRGVSLTVLGLALICAAGIWLAARQGHLGLLQAHLLLAGAVVGLLGAGVLVSGLRRRRGGWMTALGWPVLLLVLPGLVLGMMAPTSAVRATWPQILRGADARTVVTWDELAASTGGSSSVTREVSIGRLILDLRDMPADAGESLSTITASVDVGNLSVLTRVDQAVRIRARADVGGINAEMTGSWQVDGPTATETSNEDEPGRYTTDGTRVAQSEYHVTGLSQEATVSSALAADTGREAPVVTVDASTDIGSVTIIAGPDEVTWSGNAQEEVWIVYRWYEAGGSNPQTILPVPGMDHAAVSSDTAQECLDSLEDEQEESAASGDWDDNATWTDLSGLGDRQRAAYETCLAQHLSTGAGNQSGAGPEASASPAPSGSPGTAPSPGPSASADASDEASPAPSATATP